jgi:hypothetical protein
MLAHTTMHPKTLLGVALCCATSLPLAAQSSLATLYTGGNSLNSPGSVLFQVDVLNPGGLVVVGFDVNCENTRNGPIGSTFQIDVYLTAPGGTYLGNQANPAAWTQIATGQAISGALGTPTYVDVSDFFLPPGSYGMALNFVIPAGQAGTAYAYTNGNGTNQTYSDGNLQISLGSASSGVFTGAVYNPRVWNGAIHYEAGTNAAYGVHGTGCAAGSPAGIPELRPAAVNGVPRLGALFEQDLLNLPAAPGLGIMIFGLAVDTWGPWTLPLDLQQFGMPGCMARVRPDASVTFGYTGSTHTYLTAFPSSPAFAGLVLGTQALLLDPAATNPVAATLTNLTAGRIGN